MLSKIIHFIVLFAYVNIIIYESDPIKVNGGKQIFEGDSLIGLVLDNLLNFKPVDKDLSMEIANEDYRNLSKLNVISPVIITLLLFTCIRQLTKQVKTKHPFYQTVSVCLPYYYQYLFRYKPA